MKGTRPECNSAEEKNASFNKRALPYSHVPAERRERRKNGRSRNSWEYRCQSFSEVQDLSIQQNPPLFQSWGSALTTTRFRLGIYLSDLRSWFGRDLPIFSVSRIEPLGIFSPVTISKTRRMPSV